MCSTGNLYGGKCLSDHSSFNCSRHDAESFKVLYLSMSGIDLEPSGAGMLSGLVVTEIQWVVEPEHPMGNMDPDPVAAPTICPPVVTMIDQLPVDSALNDVPPEVLQKYPMADLEKALESIQFRFAYIICGKIFLNRQSELKVCTNEAGLDTDHPGRARCKLHDSVQIVNQYRSPYSRQLAGYPNLQAIFEEHQDRGREIKKLDEELALARTILSSQLQRLDGAKPYRNDETYRNIIMVLESIRKLADTMAKIQQVEAQGVTLDLIQGFLWKVSKIIDEETASGPVKIRILDRIATEATFSPV